MKVLSKNRSGLRRSLRDAFAVPAREFWEPSVDTPSAGWKNIALAKGAKGSFDG